MPYVPLTDDPRTRGNSKLKFYFIVSGGFFFGCWLLLYVVWNNETPTTGSGIFTIKSGIFENVIKKERYDSTTVDNLVIQQPGCRIPNMSEMGPMVEPYISKVKSVICDAPKNGQKKGAVYWQSILVRDTKEALTVDSSSLKQFEKDKLQCVYQSFHRQLAKSIDEELDNAPSVFSSGIKYLNLTEKNLFQSESEEFIRVECSIPEPTQKKKKKKRKNPFYADYFAFVPLKKEVEERCAKLDQTSSGENWLNVAMIGLDALSRLNFRRQMPSSHSYLVEQMGAIEMFGFNKVGDNTFPNLVPTLMNLSESEVEKVCWPQENSFFDNCPFIWNQYRDKGYRTAFVEDTPAIAVFNYLKKGFHRQPTDYYPRPLFHEAESNIGHHFSGNCYQCLGPRLSLAVVLNYAFKFLRTFHTKKFFGFFWSTSLTHDYLNVPSQGDEVVFDFLRRLRGDGGDNGGGSDDDDCNQCLLNRTVLIVLSDHGLRWGDYRNTFQGHLEERLPLLMFVFPPWLETHYPQAVRNVRQNSRKLTTHYDLHHTMVDLLNLSALEDKVLERRQSGEPSARSRGQSLFVAVSPHRTCAQAGIPRHYCTCHDSVRKIDVNDTRVAAAAAAVSAHVNRLLAHEPFCARLRLTSVQQATVEKSTMNGTFSTADVNSQYLITVRMHPGDGLFEATVAYDSWSKTYSVVGRVSRLNLYGDQSFCVDDSVLKLYCFCIR